MQLVGTRDFVSTCLLYHASPHQEAGTAVLQSCHTAAVQLADQGPRYVAAHVREKRL